MTDLATRIADVKKKAEAATPQNFDTAELKREGGWVECPCCNGEGAVEIIADYCNYDGVAIGVQFYGIGSHFGAAEEYYRAASPDLILAMAAEIEALTAKLEKAREALEPFAKQGVLRGTDEFDDDQIKSYFTAGELRAAARVSEESKEQP